MTSSSVLHAVQHYQRNIEKSSGDVARLLHCIGKLYKLPITVEHLQETGIGRTVNGLRKHDGELGIAAEAVVNKWKELVASENDKIANNQSSERDSSDDDGDGDEHKDDDDENKSSGDNHSNQHTPSGQHSHKKHKHEKSHHKDNHKEVSSKSNKTTHKTEQRHHERHDRHRKDSKDAKKHSNHKDYHRKEGDGEKIKSDKKHENAATSISSSSKKHKKAEKHEKSDRKAHSTKHKSTIDEEKTNNVEPDSTVEIEKKPERSEKHKSSKESSRDKEKHKKSGDEKYALSTSNSGKHKHNSCESTDKYKEKPKSHKDSHSSHSKSSTSAADTTTKITSGSSSSTDRKRRHKDNIDKEKSSKKLKTSNSGSSSTPNVESITTTTTKRSAKQNIDNNEVDVDEDGIDSSMGANFADVLGMLNMPKKKAKKSINALQQQTSPIKQIENEIKKSSSSTKLKSSKDYDGPSTSSSASSSFKNLEKKPDLLASNAKLEPLDPSIALELPVITNNYKPLPLNPTVMDCVFNSSTSSSSRAPPRLFSEAEALSHGISSKTIRTKVYSGVKSGQLFQVPSLFDLCIRVLQKNIDAIEYTGGVPFDVLRPVLERASPQQLFVFEEYNPYIMEDSDVLWQQHVQRTYRTQKRQEMESWREMFMRCQDESERRLSMLAQNIKQSQKIMAEPVRKTQLAFVDSLVKPPRGVIKKQEQYGTKSKLVATPAARVAALSSVTPNAAKTGDARLRAAAAIKFDPAQVASAPTKSKKAPLMAKTLQFIRGRQRR